MKKNSFFFTVIIATKNVENKIESTLKSIINQSLKDFQIIIVDSKSSDNTIKLIKLYEEFIDVIISEEDQGIYYAWNKASKYIKGNWVHYLGAGDLLFNDDLYSNVRNRLNNIDENIELVYGDISTYDPISKVNKIVSIETDILGKKFINGRLLTPIHPEVFFKKSFVQIVNYDTKYKFAADIKFMLASILNKRPLHIEFTIVKMKLDGMTSDIKNFQYIIDEHNKLNFELGITLPFFYKFFHLIRCKLKILMYKYFSKELQNNILSKLRKLKTL